MKTHLLITAVNKYNPAFYGAGNDLNGCITDAEKMKEIFMQQDLNNGIVQILYNEDCRKHEVIASLKYIALNMVAGDRLIWFHSGHGSYMETANGRAACRCMHDNVLWDAEVVKLWKDFPKGSYVIALSDTCFSESNSRNILGLLGNLAIPFYAHLKSRSIELPRMARKSPTKGSIPIKIGFLAISSCNAFQVSWEDQNGGIFTQAIEKSIDNSKGLDWEILHERVCRNMPPEYNQNPILETNSGRFGKLIRRLSVTPN